MRPAGRSDGLLQALVSLCLLCDAWQGMLPRGGHARGLAWLRRVGVINVGFYGQAALGPGTHLSMLDQADSEEAWPAARSLCLSRCRVAPLRATFCLARRLCSGCQGLYWQCQRRSRAACRSGVLRAGAANGRSNRSLHVCSPSHVQCPQSNPEAPGDRMTRGCRCGRASWQQGAPSQSPQRAHEAINVCLPSCLHGAPSHAYSWLL